MSPEWLLESVLLLAGVFAGAAAVSLLIHQQRSQAMRVGAIGLTFLALAVFLGTNKRIHTAGGFGSRRPVQQAKALKPLHPRSATTADSAGKYPEAISSASLYLGDVIVRVAPSDRYVLAVDGEQFLVLESDTSGLFVTCRTVESHDPVGVRVSRNVIAHHDPGTQSSKPDPHTILVRELGADILRIRYLEPRRIEVAGRFFVSDSIAPIVIYPSKGIHWKGGSVPPGSAIDLTPQGRGKLNFEPSGLIQIVRK